MVCQSREKFLQKKRDYYQGNKKHLKEGMAKYRKEHLIENRGKMREYAKAYRRRRKLLLLSHYSQGQPTCATCGENRIACLTIDHIDGGGGKHRQSVGEGTSFYNWLRDNNYPDGYQVLCMNCQWVNYFGE